MGTSLSTDTVDPKELANMENTLEKVFVFINMSTIEPFYSISPTQERNEAPW